MESLNLSSGKGISQQCEKGFIFVFKGLLVYLFGPVQSRISQSDMNNSQAYFIFRVYYFSIKEHAEHLEMSVNVVKLLFWR